MRLHQTMTAMFGLMAMLSAPLAQPAPQPEVVALTGVTIIDVAASSAANALKTNQTVVVTGNRIAEVGATDQTRVPPSARRIDGRGKFLIPGLWDMHIHLMNTEERAESFPLLFVANGVTGVRDMGEALSPARVREIRARIDRGETMGPRIGALAGTILEGPRGRGAGPFMRVANEAEARIAVDGHKSDGADFIKVYNGLSREAYLAIVDEAKRVGLPVAGQHRCVDERVRGLRSRAAHHRALRQHRFQSRRTTDVVVPTEKSVLAASVDVAADDGYASGR